MKRRLIVVAAIAAFAFPCVATAAPASTDARVVAQERAYTLSLMCWTVASYYKNEADILRTGDALRKMAAAMGYDNARTAKDVTTMASVLGVELRNDPGSMERNRAACRKIGLVS